VRILFLDIDGVLNSSEFLTHQFFKFYKFPAEDNCEFALQQIDEKAVQRLNRLFEVYPDLRIVLSSTWRKLYPLSILQELLEKKGLKKNVVIGQTPTRLSDRIRGYEIKEWLDDHSEVDKFVILDDDANMISLLSHLIRTNYEKGLTEKDVDKVLNILQ